MDKSRDTNRRHGRVYPGHDGRWLWQGHNLLRIAGQFQNVRAGIGAVDDVDIAAIVGLEVVGLDRDLATVLAVYLDTTLVGIGRDRRNEIANFGRVIGIANIKRANAG